MTATWVKIDDDLPWNRKVTFVSVPARWAYVASICYAGRGLTDGLIPKTALDLPLRKPCSLAQSEPWHIHAVCGVLWHGAILRGA